MKLDVEVMSFNLRGFYKPKEASNNWNRRKTLIQEIVRNRLPGIIGFQEAKYEQISTLKQNQYDFFAGKPLEQSVHSCYNFVAWNKERFEVENKGGLWLSRTPTVFSKSWNATFVKSMTWVTL